MFYFIGTHSAATIINREFFAYMNNYLATQTITAEKEYECQTKKNQLKRKTGINTH